MQTVDGIRLEVPLGGCSQIFSSELTRCCKPTA